MKSRIEYAYSLLITLALAGALTGCASDAMMLMRSPAGETQPCDADPWGDLQYQRQVDQCVALYMRSSPNSYKFDNYSSQGN